MVDNGGVAIGKSVSFSMCLFWWTVGLMDACDLRSLCHATSAGMITCFHLANVCSEAGGKSCKEGTVDLSELRSLNQVVHMECEV
eukprot:926505-Amphidinium_carterae.2